MEVSTSSAAFPFPAHLEILPEWEAAARRFLEVGGVRFVKLGKLHLILEGEELPHV
jgi:hypothetical protein